MQTSGSVGGALKFRAYQPDDVDAMHRLDLECFSKQLQFDRQTMLAMAEAPGAIIVVAEAAGVIVGFVIVHLEGLQHRLYGYVVTIDVDPYFRRAGMGGELLSRAEEEVRAVGAHEMMLHVATNNTSAVSFYVRRGYALRGTARNFYREARLDAAIYRKTLC